MPTYYTNETWAGPWTVETGAAGTGATWYPAAPATTVTAPTYTVGNNVTVTLTGNTTTAMHTIDAVNVFVQQLTAREMDEYYNGGWARGLPQAAPQVERTPEELEAEQARREEQAERWEAARARARELLFEFLDPEQREQYEDDGTFEFTGSHGTRYQLSPGTNGNIQWVDDEDRIGGYLCAHPRPYDGNGQRIPQADLHLGQLLALTTDELAWLAICNVHRGDYPPVYRRFLAESVVTTRQMDEDHEEQVERLRQIEAGAQAVQALLAGPVRAA